MGRESSFGFCRVQAARDDERGKATPAGASLLSDVRLADRTGCATEMSVSLIVIWIEVTTDSSDQPKVHFQGTTESSFARPVNV